MDTEHAIYLTQDVVRRFDREGGTFLRTSRIQPSQVKCIHTKLKKYRNIEFEGKRDMTPDVIKNLQNLKIDTLIAIGGDDTLSYALHLHKQGFPVIGIPKTMDGDVAGTDYCIGFSTAIKKANEYVTDLRSHLGSHERIGVIEIFGRHSGFTGLYTALAAKPDRLLIPEVQFDINKLAELLIHDKKRNPTNYCIVVVSEGAKPLGGEEVLKSNEIDDYGHRKLGGIGERIANKLEEITGEEVTEDNLRYSLRSGSPTAKDKIIASRFANLAMDAILGNRNGVMTAIKNGKLQLVSLEETAASPVMVDHVSQYDSERYRPNYKGLEGSVILL